MLKLLLTLSYWKVYASSRWQKKLFGSISNFCIPFTSVSTFNLNKPEKANCNPATRSQLCKWTLCSHHKSSYLFRNVVEMNITEAHRDLGHYSSPGSQNMNISLLCDGDDDCFHSSASPDKNYWALLLLVLCVSVVFGNVLVTLYSFIND